MTQPFFVAQFRNPQSPDNPNFRLAGPRPPLQGRHGPGDSGGPLFAMINGQLTQIGVVRGWPARIPCLLCGTGRPTTRLFARPEQSGWGDGFRGGHVYGEFSHWTPINVFRQWIAQNNPLRQVTAAAGNFNWSNPAAWIDSVSGPAGPNGAVPDNTAEAWISLPIRPPAITTSR